MAKIVTLVGKEGYDSSVEMYPQTVFQAVRDASSNKTLQTLTDELIDANNYININEIDNHPTGYPGRAIAVSYVPVANRKAGLCVTYKDASQGNKWIDAQFIGLPADVSTNWTNPTKWQNIGPVDVSTMGTSYNIKVGDASVGDIPVVSVSQNTSTGDDTLNIGNTKAGAFADADKLIEIVGFGAGFRPAGVTAIGDIYYNTNDKQLKRATGLDPATAEIVPFYKGAIYTCKGDIYIWNGTDMVNKTYEFIASQNLVNLNTLPILADSFIDAEEEKSTSAISLPSFDNAGNNVNQDSIKNWFSTDVGVYYHIKGVAVITGSESLIASFTAYPSTSTFISSYNTYVKAGTYNIDCIVKAKSVRMTISNGLSVYKITQKNVLTKRIVDHLSTPTNDNSTSSIRIINSVIPKGAKITEFSFKPRQAGTTKMYLFKYENEVMTLMEMQDVTASDTSNTIISSMLGRTFDYDCFVGFINNNGVTGCVGFDRNYRSQFSTPLSSVGIVGSTFDFNLVSSTVGCMCMRVEYDYVAQRDNLTTDIIRVGNNKECQTIQDAVNRSIDGDTIIIYPGQYNERVQAWGKFISLIGVNKQTCILLDDRADYRTPPLEMSIGYVSNLTIKETAEHPIIDSSVMVGDFPALNMAYCIHSECGDNGNGKNLIIENCILWNANRPCVGAGLYENQGLEIRNTYMYSGIGVVEGYHRGALYVHAKTDGVINQRLRVSNCEIHSDDDYTLYLRGYAGGAMTCLFFLNLLFNSVLGKADNSVVQNFGTGISLNPASFGNNINILNYQE